MDINYLNEIWKDIYGYQASNYGRIKSFKNGAERVLKPTRDKLGYERVALCTNGKVKGFLVHRLVWEAFNGPIPKGFEINHMDENPGNNRLDNLNLLTHKDNLLWGTVQERRTAKRIGKKHTEETKKKISAGLKGKLVNHPKKSKIVLQYTLDDEFIKEWPSAAEIQRQLKYLSCAITECCRGTRKTAYNYKWKYE